MGMVFAINPPATGNTFDKYKQNALGQGTATVTATSTDCTTTSTVTPWTTTETWASQSWAPPAASPPPMQMPGYNIGEDGQCQCVCNVAFDNGPVDNLQGINYFGGQVGNVNSISPFSYRRLTPSPLGCERSLRSHVFLRRIRHMGPRLPKPHQQLVFG